MLFDGVVSAQSLCACVLHECCNFF